MEKKTNDMLIIAATVLMLLMGIVMFYQNKTLNEYKDIINKTDTTTIVEKDTLYLDKIVRDTIPTVQYETIIKRDTVYQKEGDSIVAQPLLIKKKYIKIQ